MPILTDVPDSVFCREPFTAPHNVGYPCLIAAIPTGVVLRPTEEGSPDGGVFPVAMDSRGRFITRARFRSSVLVWSPGGDLLGTIGEEGEGPGQLRRRGAINVMVDEADSIHVRDGAGRWSVWDPDLRFRRMFRSEPGFGSATHLVEEGRILYTRGIDDGHRGSVVHYMDRAGRHLESVGAPRPGREQYTWAMRPSARGAHGEIWIAPPPGTGEGYVLERRSSRGELLDVMRRDVEWLPLEGYPDEPAAPDFKHLRLDSAGVLWVAVAVKDARWSARGTGRGGDSDDALQADLRFEAIDTQTGVVLGSMVFDRVTEDSLPPIYPVDRWGRWGRHTFGVTADALGQRSLGMHRLVLIRSEYRALVEGRE